MRSPTCLIRVLEKYMWISFLLSAIVNKSVRKELEIPQNNVD